MMPNGRSTISFLSGVASESRLHSFSPALMDCHVNWSFDVVTGCKLKHEPGVAA